MIVGLRFFGWASLELASEAGLFRPDILTDHTLIARTKLIFDRKLFDHNHCIVFMDCVVTCICTPTC